jgi:hypothetical protein
MNSANAAAPATQLGAPFYHLGTIVNGRVYCFTALGEFRSGLEA